ncbi:unnamed protein product [Chrysoparadoxa australica]
MATLCFFPLFFALLTPPPLVAATSPAQAKCMTYCSGEKDAVLCEIDDSAICQKAEGLFAWCAADCLEEKDTIVEACQEECYMASAEDLAVLDEAWRECYWLCQPIKAPTDILVNITYSQPKDVWCDHYCQGERDKAMSQLNCTGINAYTGSCQHPGWEFEWCAQDCIAEEDPVTEMCEESCFADYGANYTLPSGGSFADTLANYTDQPLVNATDIASMLANGTYALNGTSTLNGTYAAIYSADIMSEWRDCYWSCHLEGN